MDHTKYPVQLFDPSTLERYKNQRDVSSSRVSQSDVPSEANSSFESLLLKEVRQRKMTVPTKQHKINTTSIIITSKDISFHPEDKGTLKGDKESEPENISNQPTN